MNKKGASVFVNLIVYGLALIIFIFAAPMLYAAVSAGVQGQGTLTAFIMKLFLWVILIVFVAVFYKIVAGGDGFFA